MAHSEDSAAAELLENAAWMNSLARALVSDWAVAEDIVQETWLAALKKPPISLTRPWLHRVIQNLAFRFHRTEYSRKSRERVVARAEMSPRREQDVVERVEIQREIVGAVLRLDEPYRSTVLLHFFEELSPGEIAVRQDTPVTTVRSRLKKALELLRFRLDSLHAGNRTIWAGVLSPLLGFPVAPSATREGSSVVAAATGKSAATQVLSSLAVGGVLMTNKAVVGVVAVCAVSLAVGFGVGNLGVNGQPVEKPPESKNLQLQLERTQAELKRVRREKDHVASSNLSFRQQLDTLKELLAVKDLQRAVETHRESEYRSGLPWSEFANAFAEGVHPIAKLARGENLTFEEAQAVRLLGVELLKISSQARAQSKHPFFDEDVFPDLISSLFKESLALTESQLNQLDRLSDSILEGLPENVDALFPMEKLRLREEMTSKLWEGMEKLLGDDQLESFDTVRNHVEGFLFAYGGEIKLGLSTGAGNFATNWLNSLLPMQEKPSVEAVVPIASNFLGDAQSLIEKYAATNEALENLPADTKARLEGEMRRLQDHYEMQLHSVLTEEQKDSLFQMEPILIRFKFGGGVQVRGRKSHF